MEINKNLSDDSLGIALLNNEGINFISIISTDLQKFKNSEFVHFFKYLI